MAASSAHVGDNERRMHASSSTPGQSFTEMPATPDDGAVAWSGAGGSPPHVAAGQNPGPVVGSTDDLASG